MELVANDHLEVGSYNRSKQKKQEKALNKFNFKLEDKEKPKKQFADKYPNTQHRRVQLVFIDHTEILIHNKLHILWADRISEKKINK